MYRIITDTSANLELELLERKHKHGKHKTQNAAEKMKVDHSPYAHGEGKVKAGFSGKNSNVEKEHRKYR